VKRGVALVSLPRVAVPSHTMLPWCDMVVMSAGHALGSVVGRSARVGARCTAGLVTRADLAGSAGATPQPSCSVQPSPAVTGRTAWRRSLPNPHWHHC
jgi:hypothetical protein